MSGPIFLRERCQRRSSSCEQMKRNELRSQVCSSGTVFIDSSILYSNKKEVPKRGPGTTAIACLGSMSHLRMERGRRGLSNRVAPPTPLNEGLGSCH